MTTRARAPGIHVGAFGWLEDVRPRRRAYEPVTLDGATLAIFSPPGAAPLQRDPSNGGFLHAPSLNHAVTAAVLRSGYLANATPETPDALAVGLSSRRVRTALDVLEGMRNGQSLAALLGYQLERGLHDAHGLAEVDELILDLRKAFPLVADRLAATQTDPGVPIDVDRGAQRRGRARARDPGAPERHPDIPLRRGAARRRARAGGRRRRRGRPPARRLRRRLGSGALRVRAPDPARQPRSCEREHRQRGRRRCRPSPRSSRRRAAASRSRTGSDCSSPRGSTRCTRPCRASR